MFGKKISCSINPSFDLINEENLPQAEIKKKYLVIGGGPAGMEAAYVLHKRGHKVVLCEANNELGGQVRLAAIPIGKQELTKVIKYLALRLKATDVDIRLNTYVTEDMLKTEFNDFEVIATYGAKPITIKPFEKFKDVMTADDILSGSKFPGRKIIIIGGGSVGCELADYLAPLLNDRFPRNRDITVIEMAKEVMPTETGAGRSLVVQRMLQKGIKLESNAKVIEVTENTIIYEQNNNTFTIDDADTLVFAVGYRVDTALKDILDKLNIKYHLIGDCNKVASIKEAINDAWSVTKDL